MAASDFTPESTSSAPDAYELFVRLFAENSRRILAYIHCLLPDRSHAEEIFQNTSVVLWREFGTFRRDGDFSRWACAIAFNQVRNYRRKLRSDRLIFDDALVDQLGQERLEIESAELDRRRSALAHCLQTLRPQDRELVQQCYSGSAKFNVIAERMNRPVNTVYKALNRIRAALTRCIDRRLKLEA